MVRFLRDQLRSGRGIALDAAGNAYLTGDTRSLSFPTTPGAFDTRHNGSWDAFVTKLNATAAGLSTVLFSVPAAPTMAAASPWTTRATPT